MSGGCALVTGASGFIGSRLVRALVERGDRVKAFVRAGSRVRHLEDLPRDRLELVFGDILVGHTVYAALAGCDRLYHVASNYKMWDRKPERILQPAIEGTRETLMAARRRGLDKIVVTSSVGALGATREPEPMDESHAFNLPDAETYVLSKHEAEKVALELAADGMPIVVVQPCGVFGPGDWKPTPSGDGVLKYLSWPTGLGFPTTEGGLSIVDVDDVAAGHIAAMDRGRLGERYILGGENVTYESMFQLLHEITGLARPASPSSQSSAVALGWILETAAKLFHFEPPVTRRLARDYVGGFLWVTAEKAESELGYTHRPARETLSRSVKWYLEHGYVPEKAARRVNLELRLGT